MKYKFGLPWRTIVGVWLITTATFLFFQTKTIFGGDAGDLVSAAGVNGVAHPPGYPLYTWLGSLLIKLPWLTPAWRVSLLSSLPAGLTITLVFMLIYRLTKNQLASLIGAFSLAFSYLFWLYAVVPEAFSLNNLFLIGLTYLSLSFIQQPSLKTAGWAFFIAGLAMSHHHFSVWFYPIFIGLVWYYQKAWWRKNKAFLIQLFGLFFLGLLPYLYVPLAAKNYPPISWNNATSLNNFWRLFTRAGYGTFLSHSESLKVSLGDRLFLFYGQLVLLLEYFSWLGLVAAAAGLEWLYHKHKPVFSLLVGLLVWHLVFIFYSGFAFTQERIFGLGVYKRFLLPAVVWLGPLIGLGWFNLAEKLSQILKKKAIINLFLLGLLLVYPLSLFLKNYPVFKALKTDLTAETYAQDILQTPPPNSILLLSFDNPLFNSQYLHYCLNVRPDLDILHLSLFEQDYFYPVAVHNYPNLKLPDQVEKKFIEKFLELNPDRPIYTNNIKYFQTGAFVPEGLLYRYYPNTEVIPSLDEVYASNQKLWLSYHDPKAGILSWFQPVTLAAILDDYRHAAKDLALLFYQTGHQTKAEEFLNKANYFNFQDREIKLEDLVDQN